MGILNRFKKQSLQVDNVDLAIALFSSVMMGGYPTSKPVEQKLVDELLIKLDTREKILLKVIELCGVPKKSRELFIVAKAYVWLGSKYREQAIYYLEVCLQNELWDQLAHAIINVHGYDLDQKKLQRARLLTDLGKCYEGQYQFEKALSCYLNSQELDPISPSGILHAANIYVKMNDLDGGLALLNRAKDSEYYKIYKWISAFGEAKEDDTFRLAITHKINELKEKKARGYKYKQRKKS